MKHRRLVSLALLCAISSFVPTPTASASCPILIQPFEAWYAQAEAVFVGSALEVSEVSVPPPAGESPDTHFAEYTTRFHVDEVFKGDLGDEVTVLAEKTWHDCIVEFDVGERYVVFAFRRASQRTSAADHRSDVALRTDFSSPGGRVEARPDTLAFLRRRAALGHSPSLVGTVFDRTPQDVESIYGRSRIGWYGVTTRAGVPVVLTNGDRRLSTTSEADGGFAFDDVPDGVYTIQLELPEGDRLLDEYAGAPTAPLIGDEPARRVEIKAGETASRYFAITSAAHVSGRAVSPTGEAINGTSAHLVLASELERFRSDNASNNIRAFVGEDGRFDFDVVPPGEYVLVVNPDRVDAFDRRGPTFYHPGVTDPSKATRFRIVAGMKLDLGDLKAPRAPDFRPVDVSVVDAAGRGRAVDLRCVVEPAGTEISFATDDEGRVRIFLRPRMRFRLEVETYPQSRQAGTAAEIGAERRIAPVRLVAPSDPEENEDQ